MKRLSIACLLTLSLAGCSAEPKSEATATPPAASGADAVTAEAPQLITELTDQKVVYECPKCGMTFDRAGQCSMEGADLVETQVDYICPADNKPVERAGKCPRCAMNARIDKTAMAASEASATTGN